MLLMKGRSFLDELRSYLIYVKVGEKELYKHLAFIPISLTLSCVYVMLHAGEIMNKIYLNKPDSNGAVLQHNSWLSKFC